MEKFMKPMALTLNKTLKRKKFMTELITLFHKLSLNNFRIFYLLIIF